jgi:hypothetical protein
LDEPVPAALSDPLEDHKPHISQSPQNYIHPILDGMGDEQDWNAAGRLAVGGARGTMHRSSLIQRIWYGRDHLNFYLRFDFQAGQVPTGDVETCLHLFWFYPDQPMFNSPIPLMHVPDQAPLNYQFHHHLQIHLGSCQIGFFEAGEHFQWHPRNHQTQLGLMSCLEIGIPWANLGVVPDWSLRLQCILSEQQTFKDALPDDFLIPIQVP